MLHSLHIKNIQSHKDSFLEFDPGVNIVIGGSDQGKSAIFNSIYWCIYNRPLGDEHRSWESLGWKGPMSSEIELEEGISIKLERDKQSIYTIDPCNGDEPLIFKAFGQEPPSEITNIFNINRKINIQQQLEKGVPIFLISESPGDVAKHFNKVAGLYKIDTTIDIGKKEVNKADKELKIVGTQIKDKKEELKKYAGLNNLNELIKEAQELETKILENTEFKDKLQNTLNKINKINSSLEIKLKKLKLKDLIKDGILLYNRIKEQKNWVNNKKDQLRGIKNKEKELILLNKKLLLKPLIDKAIQLNAIGKEYDRKKDRLQDKLDRILKTNDKIERLSIKRKEIQVKFDNLWPEEGCPLCGK